MKKIYPAIFILFFLSGCVSIQKETTQDTARKFYIQGLLYEVNGDVDNALFFYKKSLEKEPESSFLYSKIGRALLRQRKFKEAERMFLKAISFNEKEPENYLNLGLTYFYLRAYDKAISFLEKGLKIKEFPSYRMVLCDLYTSTYQYEKAIDSYRILIETFPSNFLLHYNSGLLFEKVAKQKEAEESFLKAIKYQPSFVKSYIELGSLYEKENKIDKALDYYKKAIEIAPDNPEGYEKIIECYINQGNWKEVENMIALAIKKNIRSSTINQILGAINFQNKKYQEAEIYYKRALMVKEDPVIWFNLGVIYDKMGNKIDMERCMRRVIELEPDNHLALNYLGYSFLLENKNIDEAFNMIQKAVKLDPDNGAYLDSLGWAYYKKGNYKLAEKFLLRAQEKEKDPEIFEHLGYLYNKKNDIVKAIYWWARAQEISPKEETSRMIENARQNLLKSKK